jgi:antitoxin component YwqK of YwqJK toxin-antitoxin module
MRFTSLICILFALSGRLAAQEIINVQFTSEEDNRLIKETDTVKYYVASGDTTDIVAINEEASTYRLLSKDHKLIADGTFVAEGDKILQDGNWTERFDNGKIKRSGNFSKGKPIGTWEEFYDNGKPKMITNYAILKDGNGGITSCLSGSFHEYYKSGRIKAQGFYAAAGREGYDTIEVEDPVTRVKVQSSVKTTIYTPEKTGHWELYDENGEMEKKDE